MDDRTASLRNRCHGFTVAHIANHRRDLRQRGLRVIKGQEVERTNRLHPLREQTADKVNPQKTASARHQNRFGQGF